MNRLPAARRRPADDDDDGFALIYVLFVTTLVLIGTASMLTVTVGQIGPAKRSQDTAGALTAARSGIEDFVAHLNARCRTLSIQSCDWLSDAGPVTGTSNDQRYTARAVNPEDYVNDNDGVVRIVSTGTVGDVSRTLTADVSGVPSVLRFAYFSNYETLGTRFLDGYYPARTIKITDTAVAQAMGLPVGSRVTWNGTSGVQANGWTDAICDRAYYDDGQQGRAGLAALRTALDDGTDFREDGSTQSPAQQVTNDRTAVSRDVPCEVSFSKGMAFTGPVYSHDALRISYGEYGSTAGPAFAVPSGETLPALSTGWTTGSAPAAPAALYRSDTVLGGVPSVTKNGVAQPVQSLPGSITLPSTASPRTACVFTGPTGIVLSGTTAIVTSPLTSSSCVARTGSTFTVPVRRTTIQVQDATGSTITGRVPTALGVDNLTGADDVTPYSATAGDAYVQGRLTGGRLSIVTSGDVVATGDVTTTSTTATVGGEKSWTSGAAIALVATGDVRIYHPVGCATSKATTPGWCNDDATGLYATVDSGTVLNADGTLAAAHPARQYVDVRPARDVELDAAVMALQGSLRTDNANRGTARGTLTVRGGVYQNHRGAVGQLWETPAATTAARAASGYRLQIDYVSYTDAGLPYVPVLDTGNPLSSPWLVLSIATGGTP
ncbi:hypothetical protein [Jatrophihabitans fulvus]